MPPPGFSPPAEKTPSAADARADYPECASTSSAAAVEVDGPTVRLGPSVLGGTKTACTLAPLAVLIAFDRAPLEYD